MAKAEKKTAKLKDEKLGKLEKVEKVEKPEEGEKLHKVLARSGIGSRREMERWIEQGRVRVDNRVARLGDRVVSSQRIQVDGRPLEPTDANTTRCLLYHKPTGEVCSRKDPEGRRTVFDGLPKIKSGRWISIGRLDYNTSGLLLFTTDGELANSLMHPSANIEREYLVRVMGTVEDEMLKAMREGVMLDDGIAKFTDVQAGEADSDGINQWYYVVLMEGRNREVRRLWESQGLTVSRLKRVRYGNIFIPSKIKKGQWQELGTSDMASLYRMAKMPSKEAASITPDERKKHKRHEGKKMRSRGVDSERSRIGSDKRRDSKAGRRGPATKGPRKTRR